MHQSEALPVFRGRPARLHLGLLAQLLTAIVPAMAVVAAGDPATGSTVYFTIMGAFLLWHLVARQRVRFVCLFTGSIPVAMTLRGYFYFNSVSAILLLGLLLWFALAWEEFRGIWRNRPFAAFFIAALLYWWLSFLRTGLYSSNLHTLDLALTAASIMLLARYRSYLATALVGIGLSALAVAAGLSPYGDRLGMAQIGEESLGNPISLGLPAALVLLLLVAHGGRWLLAEKARFWRTALLMGLAAVLLLSTSRGSWLVVFTGLLTIAVFSSGGRLSLVGWLACFAIVVVLVLASGRGVFVTRYFERAVSSDRTLAQRTTGRYQQWAAMPQILADSPVWGHGPGSGVAVTQRYIGGPKAWHSFYLQMAAETGLLGLVLVALLFGSLFLRGLRHRRLTGDLVPLIGTLGFMAIGISVSGMDAISGAFLGLGFLAGEYGRVYVMREVVVALPATA